MIGLALLLQLAVPAAISVRANGAVTPVAVVSTSDGPSVRAQSVVAPLKGSITRTSRGWRIQVVGSTVDIADGLPFVSVGDSLIPLATPPSMRDGALYVPFHFVSEVLQRVATGIMYDPVRAELRQFSATGSRANIITASDDNGRTPSTPRRATSSARKPPAGDARAKPRAGRHVIVVDAGHGGPDNGMHGPIGGGPQIYEKDVTLAVSRALARTLRDHGHAVVETRTTDTLIALSDRGRIANRANGELFISVHVNAANPGWKNPGAARGYETYFLAEAKTEDDRRVAAMENEAVRFETDADAPRGDALGFVLNDMAQNEHLRESNDLAEIVQGELARIHPGPSRGVKQAGFRVLVTAYMPAVLVEIGFGTNADEARFISDPAEQRRIADAIARAADTYFERYERRVGGSGA